MDYYIPKYEWIGFSQAARLGTVTQFDMFLLHAIEDFPDKKSYMEMEFAPLEDERDRFGQWIFVILAAKNLNNFEQIADNLCVSQAPEIICAYEMEVWKDIGIVLTDRGELDRLYTLGLRSADYITDSSFDGKQTERDLRGFSERGESCAWLFVSGFVELCYLA